MHNKLMLVRKRGLRLESAAKTNTHIKAAPGGRAAAKKARFCYPETSLCYTLDV